MTLPSTTDPVHVNLNDVLPELLQIRLGGGPGATALVSTLFLRGFDDRLAANLADIGSTLRTAYSIAETGTPATQEEREIITRAIRIYAVLLDDGLNTYVASKLTDQEEALDLCGLNNRIAMFSIAEHIFRRHLPFTYKLVCDPAVFGVSPEDADRLLQAVQELGRVLAAEPKTHSTPELRAHLQEVNRKDCEKVLMAAGILSWEDAFGGDIGNVRALRRALEQLAGQLEALTSSLNGGE